MSVGCTQQVHKVACPTGNVSMIDAEIVVICDIHCAKHMTQVHKVAIGHTEVLNILHAGDADHLTHVLSLTVDHVFHLGNERGKVSILIACHNAPGTGVITVNAGTDVLDNQICRILTGVLLNVHICDFFQQRKIH